MSDTELGSSTLQIAGTTLQVTDSHAQLTAVGNTLFGTLTIMVDDNGQQVALCGFSAETNLAFTAGGPDEAAEQVTEQLVRAWRSWRAVHERASDADAA